MSNSVNSTPGSPRIIQINTPGPQGPQGPAGSVTGSLSGDIVALNITASGVISSSLVSTDFSLIAHSASFWYISASTGDFDANTIRIGGSSWSKSDIDSLKLGKSLRQDSKQIVNENDTSTYVRMSTEGKAWHYASNKPLIKLQTSSFNLGSTDIPMTIEGSSLVVTGSTEISGSCVVSGSFTVTDLLTVLANYGQTGSFSVSGSSTLNGDVNLDGIVNVQDLLTVLAGMNVSGSTTITGSCEISGSVVAGSPPALIITGSTEITGSTTIIGDYDQTGSFSVSGSSTFIGNISASGTGTFNELQVGTPGLKPIGYPLTNIGFTGNTIKGNVSGYRHLYLDHSNGSTIGFNSKPMTVYGNPLTLDGPVTASSDITTTGTLYGGRAIIDYISIDGTGIQSTLGSDVFMTIGTSGFGFEADTGDKFVWNTYQNNVDFQYVGSEDINLFYISASTDRVGIGTSTPSTKLEVNGGIKSTYITSSGNISASGTGSFNYLMLHANHLPTSDPGVVGAVWRSGGDLRISY